MHSDWTGGVRQVEAVNASPECLVWKKNSSGITAVVPGLYRLAVGFFLNQVSSGHPRPQRLGLMPGQGSLIVVWPVACCSCQCCRCA